MSLDNFEFKVKSLFYGMEFTNGIRRELVGALAIIYFLSLGHNLVAITTMFAVSRILMTLFEFPSGAFADYYSRKKSILISFGLMSIAFLGIYFFQNFWLIVIFFILHDIAWTFQSGTTTAWVIDTLKYGEHLKKLASLFARFFFFEKTGAIVGGIIGVVIIAINFKFIWLVIAIFNFFTFLIILKYMEEINFKPKKLDSKILLQTFIHAKDSIKFLLHKHNGQIKGLAIAIFFGTLAIDGFFIEIPLIFNQILGLSPAYIAGIYSIVGFFALIAPFIGEKLVHKFDSKKPLFFIFTGIFLFMVCFALSKNIFLSISIIVLFSIFETTFITIHDSAVQRAIPSKSRATLGSAMNVIWAIANSLSVFLVGIGINYLGLINTTIISSIIALLTAFVYLFSLKY
ncbi:MAG: MFS transporter [Nanoarchaeota archaeon]|nr:MFS transporter [Nanoarchaeota archaeon]